MLANSENSFIAVDDDQNSNLEATTNISGLEILNKTFSSENSLFYKELLPKLKRDQFAKCYQTQINKFLEHHIKTDQNKKVDILICNLLQANPDCLHNDELLSSKHFLHILTEIDKFLKIGGTFVMLFSTLVI